MSGGGPDVTGSCNFAALLEIQQAHDGRFAVWVAADAKHSFSRIGDDMFIFQDRHGMGDGF